jgi:hypothetical protein
MIAHSTISAVVPKDKTVQDAPGAIFSRRVATRVSPLFEVALPQTTPSTWTVLERFRARQDGVDAVVLVDAKNASTSDFENCTDRSFQQRPHRSLFLIKEEEKNEETTTETPQPSCPLDRIIASGATRRRWRVARSARRRASRARRVRGVTIRIGRLD